MSTADPCPSVAPGDDSIPRPAAGDTELVRLIARRPGHFLQYFKIDRTISFARQHTVRKLALQLPDHLLWASSRLCRLLCEFNPAVLADSSFSSCCVDEIAAEHVGADAIVHYGYRACLSQTIRIPVQHIFGALSVDVPNLVAQWPNVDADVVVIADLHYIDSLQTQAGLFPAGVQVARPGRRCAGFDFDGAPPSAFVHVGNDETIATLLALHFVDVPRFSYDPAVAIPTISNLSPARAKALMRRRHFLIEKCKDARSIAIIAGTLAVSGYLDCIRYLQKLIRGSGRRCYTVAIGKLNVAKIANFPGVDIFVMVACPMSSVVDSLEFSADVVTPVDVDLALNTNRCPHRPYSTDFLTILNSERDECGCCSDRDVEGGDDASPRFSLISGRLVDSGGIGLETIAFNTVATVTSTRSFAGLDPCIGSTPVRPVEKGQSGIPTEYQRL